MSNAPVPSDVKGKAQVTGALALERMREVVKPLGKKGTWLSRLTDHQLAEVYNRLKIGQTVGHVVKIAQIDWGVCPDSTVRSLSRAMRDFKSKMLGDIQLEVTSERGVERKEEGKKQSRRGKAITDSLDSLGRLRWAIETQTERVQILVEREKNALPFKFTGREMELLTTMLDKYINIQMRLGLLDEKPPELNLNIKHRFDGLLEQTVQPGTGVIDAAAKWLEECEKHALTLTQNEDGSYEVKQ